MDEGHQRSRHPRRLNARAFGVALAACSACAAAADFPSRPLRMIVPYAPGGNADIMARLIAQRLSENVGQQVVVDNRAGASGIIGTEIATKAPPDGYSIVLVASSIASNPGLIKSLPYNADRDLAPISLVGSTPLIIAAYPGLGASNVKELVALAKARPGQINYASSGAGSPANMAGALFNYMAGVNIVHITYKGTAQATTDVLGGQVQMFYPSMTAVLPYVKNGKLKALGMTALKRSPLAPEIPTVSETGLPGYQASIWNGILAPAATPRALIARLNQELVRVLSTADMRDRFAALGADCTHSTPEEFRTFIVSEEKKWAKVIHETGMRVETER